MHVGLGRPLPGRFQKPHVPADQGQTCNSICFPFSHQLALQTGAPLGADGPCEQYWQRAAAEATGTGAGPERDGCVSWSRGFVLSRSWSPEGAGVSC